MKIRQIDLRDHPEADLSANAERGAIVGGISGALVCALLGFFAGPGGALIAALFGFLLGALGTSLVVAATDTQGERHSRKIRRESDVTIERNQAA